MRWATFPVLLTLLLGFLVPQAVTVPVMRDGHLMIGSLDVCHSVTPPLSKNGDMPRLYSGVCDQMPASLVAYMNIPETVFPQFLLPQENDRPPKA